MGSQAFEVNWLAAENEGISVHKSIKVLFIIALQLALSAVSCYEENSLSDSVLLDAEPPTILSTSPPNGASGIDRYSGVMINFGGPMDTASVTANCYLCGGSEMQRLMDTMLCMGAPGGMRNADRDRVMSWMDSIKCSGYFVWSSNLNSCTFHPDSILMPNSEYLLFLTGHLQDYQGREMGMDGLPLGGHTFYFQTGP